MNDFQGTVVVEAPKYRIYWHDEARTICLLHTLVPRWTWEEAFDAIIALDTAVRSVEHGVYVLYLFEPRANVLPSGGSMISNLRRLLKIYAPNTLMVIFIQPDAALRVFANIVAKSFQLLSHEYCYLDSLEEALALIEAHRSAHTREQT